jgi:WhiB family redox-sensing transcriptional regulator
MTTPTRRVTTPATPDDAWMIDGLCRQVDGDLFYPDGMGGSVHFQTVKARKVCGNCPVRSECLDYALATGERFGVWGGLSEDERRALKAVNVA